MQLLTLNAAGKPLAPPRALDPSRRRLSQVIGRHVDRSRPHMIAVQRARDPLQPIEEAWVVRGRNKAGAVKPWPRRYLPADAIVVVVYLPRGGGGGASSSRGKSPLNIALGIARLALVAFAGPLGVAAAGALFGGAGASIITAGLVLGGTALLSLASRAKANKTATDTTQIYGVTGGGNTPKPGDRIPRGYGRSWMKPDLSQPDFSQYDGDDQILFKRHTLGLGKYRPYQVRAGKQVVWTADAGFVAPFNDARNAIEFVYGTASTLVPSNVVSASGIGGLLPRPADNPNIAGPFLINQRGALVTRLQVDFQFPQGISRTTTLRSGTVLSNQRAAWSVRFEYAPIDASGAIIGQWAVLYYGNSGSEGPRFSTHPLRYTKFLDVPAGRYAVRGFNIQPDTSEHTGTGDANIDACQWDAASGWVADAAIRDNVTEVALRIYATKGTQAAAFGELEVDAAAIIPVWTRSGWTDAETSKAVWAFLDIMRDQNYGGALPDDQLDLGTALAYAQRLTEFDTFDGTIRGPVSVYEAAATVLLPMRAEPVHLGRYWSLVRDEPKAVRRHVITPRQILKGSTQISFDLDTAAGAGHVVGEFDQDGDYRAPNQTTAIYGEASLTPTRQRWTGVRSFAHANHLTRWRAASGAFRRQTAPFGVEMEGRIYKRGDSILVDQWFVDTRKRAGIVDNAGDVLILDADVVIQAGDACVLRDRTGRQWGPVAIAGQGANSRQVRLDPTARANAEASTGLSLSAVLSDGRGEMTTILVGALSALGENYLIQSVKPSGPDKAQVEALIDDARVWDAIGAPITVPPVGYGGLSDPVVPSILGLTANAVPIAAGLRCDYAIKPGRGSVAFEIGLSYDGGNRFDTRYGAPVTGTIDLNPVDPTNLVLRARAFGATGLAGPYYLASLALPRATVNAALPPIEYVNLATAVQAQIDRLDGIQKKAEDAAKAADKALADALARLDLFRKALARDPNVRQGLIDPIVADLRQDIDILTQAATRNAQDVSAMRDALTTAGLETIPAQGRVRFYAIEALQTSVGSTISNFSVSVDALSKKIELYGSVQTGDLSGLITSITTVQTTLNALQGTITNYVSAAQFNPLADRVSSAETKLDAQTAAITSKASQTVVDAQGVRIGTAEQRISASEGRIFQAVQASAGSQFDLALLPQTLSGFFDFIQRQQGALSQQFATATTNIAANIDEAGRSTASVKTELIVFKGDASAQFVDLVTAVADTNFAVVTRTTALQAGIATAQAQVVSESIARASADAATASRLDSVSATVGSNTAGITSLAQAQADDRSTTASQFSGVTARFGSVESSVYSLSVTTASADMALGQRIDTVTARVGGAEAGVASEANVRASQDSAIVSYVNQVNAKTDAANAGVSTEASARASADAALSATTTDLYARSNIGTAFGRFAMTVASAPGGVSARLAMQVSTDSYGVLRNAGMFIDLLPDGQSQIVLDANRILFTANGGASYPFQFDGVTLRVPNLILTGGNVPAGVANTPARFDAANYLLIGGAGVQNSVTDNNMACGLFVERGDFPSVISVYGNITLEGSTTVSSLQILVDGVFRSNMLFNGTSVNAASAAGPQSFNFQGLAVIYLGPGNHTVQFRYTYQGNGANSKATINDIHVAGFTPRA